MADSSIFSTRRRKKRLIKARENNANQAVPGKNLVILSKPQAEKVNDPPAMPGANNPVNFPELGKPTEVVNKTKPTVILKSREHESAHRGSPPISKENIDQTGRSSSPTVSSHLPSSPTPTYQIAQSKHVHSSHEEEADDRIMFHINDGVVKHGVQSVLVDSPDTDVFVNLIFHFNTTWQLQKLYVKLGNRKTKKTVPVHLLVDQLDNGLVSCLPAIHALSGCDSTSKVGPKLSGLKASIDLSLLEGFGVKELSPQITSNAEKFLVSGLKKTYCSTFDEYRWEQYHNSKTELDFNQLVCCSSTIREHIKRAYLQCKMWLQAPTPAVTKPDPLQYGYEATDVGITPVILPVSCRPDDLPPPCKCPRALLIENKLLPSTPMKSPVKLIDEHMQWSEGGAEFFLDQSDFYVIGVIGMQGVGKSSIMSMLANGRFALSERSNTFRIETKDHREVGEHATGGIDMYITSDRIILLDVQPVMSASVLERLLETDKRHASEFSSILHSSEIPSLQLMSFLYTVCHTVLVVQDWITDINLLKNLQTAEMLKPSLPSQNFVENSAEDIDDDYYPHIGSVGMDRDNLIPSLCGLPSQCDMNLFMLPQKSKTSHSGKDILNDYEGSPGMDVLSNSLYRQIYSMPRSHITRISITEKDWFLYAAKSWESIKKSNLNFFTEYGRVFTGYN
ncbi:Protein SMG9 [Nymphon striatum]|nr:Protein SMG9 [Nymphon striatum]